MSERQDSGFSHVVMFRLHEDLLSLPSMVLPLELECLVRACFLITNKDFLLVCTMAQWFSPVDTSQQKKLYIPQSSNLKVGDGQHCYSKEFSG